MDGKRRGQHHKRGKKNATVFNNLMELSGRACKRKPKKATSTARKEDRHASQSKRPSIRVTYRTPNDKLQAIMKMAHEEGLDIIIS